jgi:hypothetical protein
MAGIRPRVAHLGEKQAKDREDACRVFVDQAARETLSATPDA